MTPDARILRPVPAPRPFGPGLIIRLVKVDRAKVAMVRYVLEAHEGLGFMHGNATDQIALLTSESQEQALDRLIDDLIAEGLLTSRVA